MLFTVTNECYRRVIMKKVLVPSSKGCPRCGEGSGVLLEDGRILLVYTCFTGNEDHAPGELFSAYFDPETGDFTDRKMILKKGHYINQMSISLERLADNSIALAWGRKFSQHHDRWFFCRSPDEGKSWSEPRIMCPEHPADYLVSNNDRLRQLKNGRLVLPVCAYPRGFDGSPLPSFLELWYSDDVGENWHRSGVIAPCQAPPKPDPYAAEASFEEICDSPFLEQEPGVEECADGTLYYFCRTPLGYMYNAWSQDQGKTFTELTPQKDIISPLAPQAIRRQPGSNRLWCVYNDRSSVVFGDPEKHWSWRTPLTIAYSDDNGHSWKNWKQIEDDSHNYCYTSLTFAGKLLVMTYYESENRPDGTRRNLASFKAQCVELP